MESRRVEKRLAILTIVSCAVLGTGLLTRFVAAEEEPLPRKEIAKREDLSLREFVLNDLFESHAKPGEICYVAFGSHYDEKNKRGVYDDPPPQFLERFKGRAFTVKPASAYPQADNKWAREQDPKTKVPDGRIPVLSACGPRFLGLFGRVQAKFVVCWRLGPATRRNPRVSPPLAHPQNGNTLPPRVPDGLYTIEIVEWISPDTVKVAASMYRGPLWARGYEATLKKIDGRWAIIEHGGMWVS